MSEGSAQLRRGSMLGAGSNPALMRGDPNRMHPE
jgi:hypothetical protein